MPIASRRPTSRPWPASSTRAGSSISWSAWHDRRGAMSVRVLDVTDEAGLRAIPPCADDRFDHRTCDYWEDDARGSKAHRASWLSGGSPTPATPANRLAGNPFAPTAGPAYNPFAL